MSVGHNDDLARAIALQGHFRCVGIQHDLQQYPTGIGYAVGEILDIVGTEEIVASVAQAVGDACARYVERVGRIACPRGKIRIAESERVDHAVERRRVGQQGDHFHRIGRTWSDSISDLGFPGVATLDKLIARRASEIAIIVQDLVDHLHAHFGTHVRHKHGLGHKFLIKPVLQTRLGVAPVVVDPQSEGKRIVPPEQLPVVVRGNVDSRFDRTFDSGRQAY